MAALMTFLFHNVLHTASLRSIAGTASEIERPIGRGLLDVPNLQAEWQPEPTRQRPMCQSKSGEGKI
jgi:hypothetical protein